MAVALLAVAPAVAQVPDPYARELAQKLTRAEQGVRRQGYARAAGPFAGGLATRESRRFTLSLRAGQDYALVGVCDAHCDDVELALLDANDAVIARGNAALQARPDFTGSYVVQVGCGEARCWYAVNVYSRTAVGGRQ
jgi:hypothetical protein